MMLSIKRFQQKPALASQSKTFLQKLRLNPFKSV
jgi:hypothetical protein